MILARVEGTVVATLHHPSFDGQKLLIVQPLDGELQAAGTSFLAVDRVQAGVGDTVLVNREGNGNRQLLKMGAIVPIRSLIVGIVDRVDLSRGDHVSEAAERALVADYARRLHARGWVANHDGNVSLRLGDARYLCTPTATSKAEVDAESLLVVDEGGAKVSGRGKPFSEMALHLTVYRQRPDARAVVHAHPPSATAFGAAGLELPAMLPEAVVSLGPVVPLVPLSAPGEAASLALQPLCADHDAVLVAGNGVLAWGRDVEQAYLRLELVEHLAHIAIAARQLGGARPLPPSMLPALLEARRKAGLGRQLPPVPAAAPAKKPVVVACAPPPPGATVEVYDPKRAAPAPQGDLAAIIREEIVRALKDR